MWPGALSVARAPGCEFVGREFREGNLNAIAVDELMQHCKQIGLRIS